MRAPRPHRAWQDAYDLYERELAAFVRERVPAVVADDVLQDVWTALAATLEDEEVREARAWLYRVARNRITDLYRTRDRAPSIEIVEDLTDATHPDLDADLIEEALAQALTTLPPAQREVFERNELGGETLREIADDLGLPLKTVISRKGYARRRLRTELEELYRDIFYDD